MRMITATQELSIPPSLALDPCFTEFPALGGSDTDGGLSRLDQYRRARHRRRLLAEPPRPPTSPTRSQSPQKPYQVAEAIPNINPHGIPTFGTPLPAVYRQRLPRSIPPVTRTSNSQSQISRNFTRPKPANH